MSLISKVYELESVLKHEKVEIDNVINVISNLISCNLYLISSRGDILTSSLPNNSDCTKEATVAASSLRPELKQRISFVFQTSANIPVDSCLFHDDYCVRPGIFMTIIPVRNNRTTSAHLILTNSQQLTEEQLILAEVASLVISIYFYESNATNNEAEQGEEAKAKMVLDSLSFSELKAISNVLMDLNGTEGFLVASKIADRIGISRSVIVNAMRKLESAGVVESRSLGMKGTYIKVKNPYFLEQLAARR
jgi:transcriptional pleiotropic repressor